MSRLTHALLHCHAEHDQRSFVQKMDVYKMRKLEDEKVQALRSFPDFPKFREQAHSTVNTAEDTTETAMSIVTCMVGSMWILNGIA